MKKIISAILVCTLIIVSTVMAFSETTGDVNSDGKVNATDALCILQYAVGMEPQNFNIVRADITNDGNINSSDALIVLMIAVGSYVPESDSTTTTTSPELQNPVLSYNKAQLIDYYNSCLENSYSCNVDVIKLERGSTYNVSNVSPSSASNIAYSLINAFTSKSGNLRTKTFVDGKDIDNGSTIEKFVLPANLYDDAVKNIYIRSKDDGYRIEIVLMPELCEYNETPTYNASCIWPVDIYSSSSSSCSIVGGMVHYTGTKLVANIDNYGRITAITTNIPFEFQDLTFSLPIVSNVTVGHAQGGWGDFYSLSYTTNPDGSEAEPPCFTYSQVEQCLIATNDNIFQRKFSSGDADELLLPPNVLAYNCFRVFFEYDEYEWMVQYWKGQYDLNMLDTIGAEIGIYCRPKGSPEYTPYTRAEETLFLQSMDVYHSSYDDYTDTYSLLLSRGPSYTSWCTGFVPGVLFDGWYYDNPDAPRELKVESKITLKTPDMAQAFINALKQVKHIYYYNVYYIEPTAFRFSEFSNIEEYESSTSDGKFILEEDGVTVRVCWR